MRDHFSFARIGSFVDIWVLVYRQVKLISIVYRAGIRVHMVIMAMMAICFVHQDQVSPMGLPLQLAIMLVVVSISLKIPVFLLGMVTILVNISLSSL